MRIKVSREAVDRIRTLSFSSLETNPDKFFKTFEQLTGMPCTANNCHYVIMDHPLFRIPKCQKVLREKYKASVSLGGTLTVLKKCVSSRSFNKRVELI